MRQLKADEKIIRWPDWRDRQLELLDKAEFYDFSQCYATSEWLRLLAEKLESETPRRMFTLFLNETLGAWRTDFVGNNELRKQRVDSIQGIIFSAVALGKLDEKIQTVLPILRELGKNLENLMPLVKAFNTFRMNQDYKMSFYGMCYHYPLFVEGVFDESIRLLFLLMSSVQGIPLSSDGVRKMTLGQLKQKSREIGLPRFFFWGWENRVRNSIAHARFRYDAEKRMMYFVDIDPSGRRPDYGRWFTLEEFRQLEGQLNDVYQIIQDVIFMLRIQQLILSPYVPDPGKKLLMPDVRRGIADGMLQDPNHP